MTAQRTAETCAETCADCGCALGHDPDAEFWLGGVQVYDPDRIDLGNPATICPETDEPHRIAGRECDPGCMLGPDDDERHEQFGGCLTDDDVAEERMRARDYDAWAAL